ncbi:ABC transporter permease [Roseateles sp. DC23W]|uniref:ABC transporter permease n=1 Tax=Pelomonas dachongensis TaxID=3299029 RepID=A0ABW7ETC0_9BURK
MAFTRWVAGGVLALQLAPALGQPEHPCGSLENAYGPFDYRRERGRLLEIVDRAHFNSDVRNLRRGQSGSLGGDIDYTLRASPNHHLALASIAELGIRSKQRHPQALKRSIDCYFDRAMRFQPDDHLVRMLYASFLQRMNFNADALVIVESIERMPNLVGMSHFNLGMLLMDLGETERALGHAWQALEMGWPRTDLKERLQKGGKWRDPPDAGAQAPQAAQSASQAAPR